MALSLAAAVAAVVEDSELVEVGVGVRVVLSVREGVRERVGVCEGLLEGERVGVSVGERLGVSVGVSLGVSEGELLGDLVGGWLGDLVGEWLGVRELVGVWVLVRVGDSVVLPSASKGAILHCSSSNTRTQTRVIVKVLLW